MVKLTFHRVIPSKQREPARVALSRRKDELLLWLDQEVGNGSAPSLRMTR